MNINTESLDFITKLLPLLLPVIAIEFIFKIWAIVSIAKKKAPTSNKLVWLIIVIIINTIGWILYFAIGSKMLDEKTPEETDSE
ncbi:MAG: PLDc N-terminal domain-containing protein [Clostridiales bacterium]|jgi:hypothetical protein|nr:PLDc N-terminal domain-containing protein [Clostridiales bacterium]